MNLDNIEKASKEIEEAIDRNPSIPSHFFLANVNWPGVVRNLVGALKKNNSALEHYLEEDKTNHPDRYKDMPAYQAIGHNRSDGNASS